MVSQSQLDRPRWMTLRTAADRDVDGDCHRDEPAGGDRRHAGQTSDRRTAAEDEHLIEQLQTCQAMM